METAQAPGHMADDLLARWPAARPFLAVGSVAVVAGGLVAAVARPVDLEMGSWMAAYLVLVGGVAQIALGGGQAWLAAEELPLRLVVAQVLAWNLGLVATIVGSLGSLPVVTTVGGVVTVVALVLFLHGVRPGRVGYRWTRRIYGAMIAVVLLSTPVGLALAWVRR